MMRPIGYLLGLLGLGGCGFFMDKAADPGRQAFDEFFCSPRQTTLMPYKRTARERLMKVIVYLKSVTSPQQSPDGPVYRAVFGNIVVEHCDSPERGYTRITCKKFLESGGTKGKYELEIPDNNMNGIPDPGMTRFVCHMARMNPTEEELPSMKQSLMNRTLFVASRKQRIYELLLETLEEERGKDVDIFSPEFISRLYRDDILGNGLLERRYQ